jgi:arylsulfatase
MKSFGYATGQFGKNHLGDRNEHLPTVHGFDEFFGNLYHLNAEEEPYYANYPKDPAFRKKFGPRGVLKCKASDKDDATVDEQFGKVGKQTIENTGPLPKERMETVDEEFLGAAMGFIDKNSKANKPFFCWFNSTRMHINTHLKPASAGKTGLGMEADGMVEHDGMVGQLLKQLDDLGIADNTIVIYTTDNGAEVFSWPDGGTTPFHGEKNASWEGGYRVPGMIRWPGVVKPGTEINDIVSHEDWVPTLVAAAGEPNLTEKLLTGYQAAGKTFKVHLDGYDLRELLAGTGPSKRKEFFYWTDDGNLAALRYDRWKVLFLEQRAIGLNVWQDPLVPLRLPKLMDMRGDPFERAESDSGNYDYWRVQRIFVLVPAQDLVGQHLQTYTAFPPRQKLGSFSLDQVLAKLQDAQGSGQH